MAEVLQPYPWQAPLWQGLIARHRAGQLPHALLLSGPQGMGKRHFAESLARALLCEQPQEEGSACGQCRACLLMQAGSHPDWLLVEPEEGKQGIGIDQIRALIRFQSLTSQYGKRRVVLLAPAEGINHAAANALLKTLEEPSGETLLMLRSDRPSALLPTVRSRCQQQLFRPLIGLDPASRQWLQQQLGEGVDSQQLDALLLASGGRPLAVLSMVQQEELPLRQRCLEGLAELHAGQASAVAMAAEWEAFELRRILAILYSLLADMIRLQLVPQQDGLANPLLRKHLQALAEKVDLAFLDTLLQRVQARFSLLQGQVKPQVMLEELLLAWQQRRV